MLLELNNVWIFVYLKQMAPVAPLTLASAEAAGEMDILHNISKKMK